MSRNLTKEQFINLKRDFSELVIHLTKPNNEERLSALEVLIKIISDRRLIPYNPLGLFGGIIKDESQKGNIPKDYRGKFNSVAFSECPLEFISTLVAPVAGRKVILEPYGIALRKGFVREKGGNHVLYLNQDLQKVYIRLWKDLSQKGNWELLSKIIPLLDKCDSQRDFHWEREWRIQVDVPFELKDIAYVICIEPDQKKLWKEVESTVGSERTHWDFLPKIDPYWRPETIIKSLRII